MHWIFCSSGARELYIENIVRALALPAGAEIQFRYEDAIVSDTFKERVNSGKIRCDTAYLSYYDSDRAGVDDTLFPVREAKLKKVTKRGSSYIILLEPQRFIDWQRVPDLSKIARDRAEVSPPYKDEVGGETLGQFAVPTRKFDDEWLVCYSACAGCHLPAFESTVNALSKSPKFKTGNVLFANILGIRETDSDELVANNKLAAGRSYFLDVYHFQDGRDPDYIFHPFKIEVSAESEKIVFETASERTVQAEYDEINFRFKVDGDVNSSLAGINFSILRSEKIKGSEELVQRNILNLRLPFSLSADWPNRFFCVGLITVGVAGAQLVTLSSLERLTGGSALLALTFAAIAGIGSIAKLPMRP